MNPELEQDFQKMVRKLAKPGEQIKEQLTELDCALIHAAVGVASDSGELLDAIKKAVIYRKEIDMVNVVEELGDIEFFMEDIRRLLGISREQVILANMKKLSKRYGADFTYSDCLAQERLDKH